MHFGRRSFPEPRFKAGDTAVCWNSEETCQLRQHREYKVIRSGFEASRWDCNSMEEVLYLEGISEGVRYGAGRFLTPAEHAERKRQAEEYLKNGGEPPEWMQDET